MSKMNPEAKSKVVEALRSGKYKQGTGQLYNTRSGCHCVWGVISDISGKGTWSYDGWFRTDRNNWMISAPTEIQSWAGVDEKDTLVDIAGVRTTLMAHNDKGVSFAELAKAIEEQL